MNVHEFAKTCTGKITYGKGVLAMGEKKNDISGIAKELLETIEKECPDEKKYDIALQVLTNQNRTIYSEPTDKNIIEQIGEKILKIQSISNPPRKSEEALKEAREIKEELSRRSSIDPDNLSTQRQTEKTGMSEKDVEAFRKANIAAREAADRKAAAAKRNSVRVPNILGITWRRRPNSGGNKTKKSKKGMSMCVKKTAKKCEKVRGCKVASGKKRTYCRKKKNHTKKSHKK